MNEENNFQLNTIYSSLTNTCEQVSDSILDGLLSLKTDNSKRNRPYNEKALHFVWLQTTEVYRKKFHLFTARKKYVHFIFSTVDRSISWIVVIK